VLELPSKMKTYKTSGNVRALIQVGRCSRIRSALWWAARSFNLTLTHGKISGARKLRCFLFKAQVDVNIPHLLAKLARWKMIDFGRNT
jgi:hypothetical protein